MRDPVRSRDGIFLIFEVPTMTRNQRAEAAAANGPPRQAGPWDAAVNELLEWDSAWTRACVKMTTNPWVHGVLSRKFIELVGVALNAACTNLNPDGTRRHIRAALAAGAVRDEILMVLKMASVMSIHSCSLGTHSARRSQGRGREICKEAGDGDAGLRQDESRWTMECCVGSIP